MAELDSHHNQVLERSACIIQRRVRSYLAHKNFILLCTSAVQIQALCRGQVARHIYDYGHNRRTAAALTIQKDARRFLARKAYAHFFSSAILIQAGMRGMATRNELQFRRKTKAANIIQSHWRGHLACCQYLRFKRAAIATQCAWRARMARRELQILKLAAKDTGALLEAKSKLEKQVEELARQVQMEKLMRVEIEEAKNQEIAKLQSALEKMQVQFREIKEQLEVFEAAKKVAEKDHVVQEVPFIVHELISKLTAENEKLKYLIGSLEKKIDETEDKYEETKKLSEARLKQALEAESYIFHLETAMQRLEEKLSDIETKYHIPQQQALIDTGKISRPLVRTSQPVENGHHEHQGGASSSKRFGTKLDNKLRSSTRRHHEDVDALIRWITEDFGFSEGIPVAAFTIYKCLVHWRSFEAERTSVFDQLIQTIGSSIKDQTNDDHMVYWLSNTSTLLFLLQHTLKATVSTSWKRFQPTSFLGRVAQGFRSSSSSCNVSIAGLEGVHQVEAKYPALLFKQQLTAYVEKIYGIIRDNLKKKLSSLLSSRIQAPRISRDNSLQSSGESFDNCSLTSHWESIIEHLNKLMSTLKTNFVPLVLVQKIFEQIFSYINIQLFNSLLLYRECCTFSNGEYVKAGLDKLQLWCAEAHEYAGSSWDELKHVQQAVGFLLIHQKSRITCEDLVTDLCPILSIQQLYKICTLYWDNNYNTQTVSPDVISSMLMILIDTNDADISSILLEDSSSIPFSVHDIIGSLRQVDFTNVKPPAKLLENPAFEFLQG